MDFLIFGFFSFYFFSLSTSSLPLPFLSRFSPLFQTPPSLPLCCSTSPNSYVEQLGTFMPIEAPQAGELVAFLVEEGSPVEYRQPVAEIAPFFGGHIIGDSKHA